MCVCVCVFVCVFFLFLCVCVTPGLEIGFLALEDKDACDIQVPAAEKLGLLARGGEAVDDATWEPQRYRTHTLADHQRIQRLFGAQHKRHTHTHTHTHKHTHTHTCPERSKALTLPAKWEMPWTNSSTAEHASMCFTPSSRASHTYIFNIYIYLYIYIYTHTHTLTHTLSLSHTIYIIYIYIIYIYI